MATVQTLSRKNAAKLISDLASAAHRWSGNASMPTSEVYALLREAGIVPPKACCGQAHDPDVAGQIDNCSLCAPHWGMILAEVKIK